MKAVVVREHGDRVAIEDRPVPEPGAREVRVRMAAVGLNHLDVWVRRGVPGHTFPLPLVTSSDGSGVVDACGEGAVGVAPGDEVIVLPGVSCGVCEACQSGRDPLCADYRILGEARDGTAAEYVVVPDANLVRKPSGLDLVAAGSFALSFLTAWSMLRRAALCAGETVLVHGAGSGVGSAAIQIAKLLGADVIATAGTDVKCQAALDLGADHAINYEAHDFTKAVRELRGRAGVEVVFDHVGAKTFDGSLRCLARGGRLVTCGATTGGEVMLSLHRLFFKNLSVIGTTMGSRGDALQIVRLVGEGKLRPVVDRVLPLREAERAHRLLEERAAFGKIVLQP
ncbi:MAG: zinc-binding dehydrogenase [Planctomycetes bacterium]|nr:zinc-binding dehydrogenase [Planctomycetota bacterium]